jgi:hypothetical protein
MGAPASRRRHDLDPMRVQRLDRDGGPLGEPLAVIGYVTFMTFNYPQDASLWVRPITPLGLVGRPYALLPEPARSLSLKGATKEAIRDGVAEGFYNLIRSGTDMPALDFFDTIKDAVSETLEKHIK